MENKTRYQKYWGNIKIIGYLLGILIFTLSLTTIYFKGVEKQTLFPSNILVLTMVNVNLILVVLLVLLLSRNLIKLYFEKRQKVIGSVFRTKLIAAFIGFSLIPVGLLFVVASGFLTSSIDNWFSIQVEKSLKDSLEVAQAYYQEKRDVVLKANREIVAEIMDRNLINFFQQPITKGDIGISLSRKRSLNELIFQKEKEYNLSKVSVFSNDLKEKISIVNEKFDEKQVLVPSEEFLRIGLKGEETTIVRSLEIGDLIRGEAPIYSLNKEVIAVLVTDIYIPKILVSKMEDITKSLEDYNQLKAFKNPIKGSYILSFLIITLVILFSATWFGIYLARGITVPIQKLVEGTEEVARGNLNYNLDIRTSDEINLLIKSFNKMTKDLKASKNNLEQANISLKESNIEIEERRNYIETVLENIATGVISLNSEDKITTINHSAQNILGIESREEIHNKDSKEEFHKLNMIPIRDLLIKIKQEGSDFIEREIQIEINRKIVTLRIRISTLKEKDRFMGMVIVFEDLSELIKAQKVAAWQEVARRIAHEIKNPLTPIQLSAQRLRKKYFENAPDINTIIDESTNVIINEVSSLKDLVNEFSNFARMPLPQPSPNNLHELIAEAIKLYKDIYKEIDIIYQFDKNLPVLLLDRNQLKRVFINLIENGIESMNKKGRIWINTYFDKLNKIVKIEIIDEGIGIPPEDYDKIFIPYFSRKNTGTGLGLAIVNRIITDHNGNIKVNGSYPKGTKFTIQIPCCY